MYCKNCGKKIDDDSKFCRFCGEKPDAQENFTNIHNRKKSELGYFSKALLMTVAIIAIVLVASYFFFDFG